MEIEVFKVMHEASTERRIAGRYSDGYDMKTFLLEWFCEQGIVVGDATPDNVTIIQKVAVARSPQAIFRTH